MKRIVRRTILIMVLLGSLAAFGAVSANHDHYLITPGTCVEDIARGQTAKTADEPGGHKFHVNVHFGTPGTKAFENSNNPVSVHRNDAVTNEGCPS